MCVNRANSNRLSDDGYLLLFSLPPYSLLQANVHRSPAAQPQADSRSLKIASGQQYCAVAGLDVVTSSWVSASPLQAGKARTLRVERYSTFFSVFFSVAVPLISIRIMRV